ncbi:MAG: hypothetical protein ABII82_06675 [Verrucomicrobiota bacterium]
MTDPHITSARRDASAALDLAEDAWRTRDAASMQAALAACDRALRGLPAERINEADGAPDPRDPLAMERMALWLWRGRLLVAADQPEAVSQGLASLDQALARLRLARPGPDVTGMLITVWMNRGGGLFRLDSRQALEEGLACYERAIGLMRSFAGTVSVTLGAAWMNIGAGLLRLESSGEAKDARAARLARAAAALAEAVRVLEPVATGSDAARRNLASSWANLGVVRLAQHDPAAALAANQHAVETFRPLAAGGDQATALELAARLHNLVHAAGESGEYELALRSGREALALARQAAAVHEPRALEMELRVRHGLCVALGKTLAASHAAAAADDPVRAARLAEAGDLVEDGLAALRAAGVRAGDEARTFGARLYEFGAWLYRTCQPWFLAEFLLEHLDDAPGHELVAREALRMARQTYVQRPFDDHAPDRIERTLETLNSLNAVEQRLLERERARASASAATPP